MSFIRVVFISLCLIAGTQASVAASLNEAMQECANIKRDLMRLACFDKLSGRVTDFEIEQLTEKQRQATRVQKASSVLMRKLPVKNLMLFLPIFRVSSEVGKKRINLHWPMVKSGKS